MNAPFIRTLIATATFGCLAVPQTSVAQEISDYATSMVVDDAPVSVDLTPYMNAIRQAPDPSAAAEAYARAQSVAPDSTALKQAYVGRLITLGAAKLAETQARELVSRDPHDGVAWAVLAHSGARRNDWTVAFNGIVNAVQYQPDDPFVQRTAGELVAWYGAHRDSLRMSTSLMSALQHVQSVLAGRQAYVEGYREAREFYEQQRAPSSDYQPVPEPVTEEVYPYPVITSGSYYGGSYYPRPYYRRYDWDSAPYGSYRPFGSLSFGACWDYGRYGAASPSRRPGSFREWDRTRWHSGGYHGQQPSANGADGVRGRNWEPANRGPRSGTPSSHWAPVPGNKPNISPGLKPPAPPPGLKPSAVPAPELKPSAAPVPRLAPNPAPRANPSAGARHSSPPRRH
jgi:hypothetical protein